MKLNYSKFQDGPITIIPDRFGDNRGWFSETYNHFKFNLSTGLYIDFIQDNESFSASAGTIRGIHYQEHPEAQNKLVRCVRGAILDYAVDLRVDSPTYKQWMMELLSEENGYQLLVPVGFGHAFYTLSDNVLVNYKVDDYFSKPHDRAIRYDDPEINIEWPTNDPVLSEKDRNAPYLKDLYINFRMMDKT